ncbi:MAG: hypothetical protein ABR582_09230 [Gemmatimonadaceae bacterium]
MKSAVFGTLVLAIAVSSCGDPSAPQQLVSNPQIRLGRSTVSDPVPTWKFPLTDAALSVKSDRQYSDGSYSVYAAGVCGLTGGFFATTAGSNSGDVTLNLGSQRKCGRKLTISYDDGFVETSAGLFLNLHDVENSTSSIPIGSTAQKFLAIHYTARCDVLQFGKDANSDNVLVTRVDAHTWHAVSQPTPNDRAYCTTTGQSYHMQVDLVVVSNRDLP